MMDDQFLPQLAAGGALAVTFAVTLRLMLRADEVQREAVHDVRGDRDECLAALEHERAARIADRERCDLQLDELRRHAHQLETRVAVLEAEQHRTQGDGR